MLKRLLKLLSGLIPFPTSRRGAGRGPYTDIGSSGDNRPARRGADYSACDTCNVFLTADASCFTCRRCEDARRARFGPRPVRVTRRPCGVDIFMPTLSPTPAGAERRRTVIRLHAAQATRLSRRLLDPGAPGITIELAAGRMLTAGWCGTQIASLGVESHGARLDSRLALSAAQARRLGEAIAECQRPACDRELTGARNECAGGGELRARCGAIRAGNRADDEERERDGEPDRQRGLRRGQD